jgi:hypothetical protein
VRRALWLGILLVLGCGPAADLWLRVEAPFVVPGECDALLVQVEQVSDGARIYERTYPLTSAQQFPVTLSLYTKDAQRLAPAALRVTVTAQVRGEDVASPGSAEVTLHDDEVSQVVIRLTRLSSFVHPGGPGRALPGHLRRPAH